MLQFYKLPKFKFPKSYRTTNFLTIKNYIVTSERILCQTQSEASSVQNRYPNLSNILDKNLNLILFHSIHNCGYANLQSL